MADRRLRAPDPERAATAVYALYAVSSQAEKGWNKLCELEREAMQRCYDHLATDPFRRVPGRVFPLKGKRLRGIWEFEATAGDRVFYYPERANRTVHILQAGRHAGPPSRYSG